MSSLQLNFDFEDKLKKFIEENCPYDFTIKIYKDQFGVVIADAEDITYGNLLCAFQGVQCALEDLRWSIDAEISEEEERESVLVDCDFLEECVEDLGKLLEAY